MKKDILALIFPFFNLNEESLIIMKTIITKVINKWYRGSIEEAWADWVWIFSFSKRYTWAIIFYIIFGIMNTTTGLVSAVASKYLIDIITGYQTDKFYLILFIMVASTTFTIIVSSVISRLSAVVSVNIKNNIEAEIFDTVIDADWFSISNYSNGDILSRFNGDINSVSENAINWLPSAVISVYSFFATFFVILHYDLIMAVIALSSAPFMLILSKYVVKKQREYGRLLREVNAGQMTFQAETFYNLDIIKSFGVLELYSQKMKDWQSKFKSATLENNLFSIKTGVFMRLIASLVTLVAFCYCLYRLWTHDITYGTMTLFLSQRSSLTGAFHNLVSIIPSMLTSSVSAHRVRELVELPKEVHIEESKELEPYKKQGLVVQMDDVNYSYLEGKRVITDSDFIAKPGEIVALVGPSGEGKTTMIRLMLGLIHPEEGCVTIQSLTGESVLANVDTRHLFAYVPQGNSILSGTVAENMRMAKEDATDEEIVNALDIACAWDFVSKLENGINAKVGERGKGLSEGQAQRIAIARAILRDAPVLLLDEATSALDVETERKVLRNIIQKQPNKTCIVTTHRPSVLNMCERVYRVMDTKVTQLSEEEASRMAMDF